MKSQWQIIWHNEKQYSENLNKSLRSSCSAVQAELTEFNNLEKCFISDAQRFLLFCAPSVRVDTQIYEFLLQPSACPFTVLWLPSWYPALCPTAQRKGDGRVEVDSRMQCLHLCIWMGGRVKSWVYISLKCLTWGEKKALSLFLKLAQINLLLDCWGLLLLD